MKMNSQGLALLKGLEGCKLTAYKLKGERYYTIGYGHYGADVKASQKISQAQADELLVKDLEKFEKHVTNYAVKKFPELNENQFSALVSYCYNRGLGGLKELVNNSGSVAEMSTNIVKYWGSAELYKDALIKRRKKEQALFNRAVEVPTKKTPEEVANEVISGKWGNMPGRKERLEAAGYNYQEIREIVNNKYQNKPTLPAYAPVLKRGCRGVQVERLQKVLNYFGASLPCTGLFGDMTYYALIKYQQQNGLVPDGVYGRYTFESMRMKL